METLGKGKGRKSQGNTSKHKKQKINKTPEEKTKDRKLNQDLIDQLPRSTTKINSQSLKICTT